MLWFSGTSWPHLKRPTLKGVGIASSMLESSHYDPSDWRGCCMWGFHRISQAEQRSGGITKTKDLVEEKWVKVSSIDPRVVKAGSASDRAEQAWLLRTSTEAPTNNTRSIGSIGHLLPRKIQSHACLNMSSRWKRIYEIHVSRDLQISYTSALTCMSAWGEKPAVLAEVLAAHINVGLSYKFSSQRQPG